jgi:uncharacterized protein (DUF1778 family)
MTLTTQPRKTARTAPKVPKVRSRLEPKAQALDTSRSARVGLRSSPAQVEVLRRAADVAHKSLTDFILDSACLAAEQTLLDQRLFLVDNKSYEAFMAVLDRPVKANAGLKDLFARPTPWAQ